MESNNMYKNGIPQFDAQKYAFCIRRMKTYMHAQRFEIWQSVVDGYKEPTVPPTNERAIKLRKNNSKATNALLNAMKNALSLYKLSRRNVVGMLTMVVQNT
jgi:hypothetical protein